MTVENVDWDDEKLYSDKNDFATIRHLLIHALKSNHLKRVDNGTWEEIQEGVEYFSPEQHGVYHGIVYRQYFTDSLPSELTSGTNVSVLVDYKLYADDGTDRHIGHGSTVDGANILQIYQTGVAGNGNLVLQVEGLYLTNMIHGWVDYTK